MKTIEFKFGGRRFNIDKNGIRIDDMMYEYSAMSNITYSEVKGYPAFSFDYMDTHLCIPCNAEKEDIKEYIEYAKINARDRIKKTRELPEEKIYKNEHRFCWFEMPQALAVVLYILFCGPIGITLMWIGTMWKTKTKIILTIIPVLLIAAMVVLSGFIFESMLEQAGVSQEEFIYELQKLQ